MATLTAPPLTLADRCIKCGGQALLRVCLKNGEELLFCAGYGTENFSKLKKNDQIRAIFNALGGLWWIPPLAILTLR
jgi:hypothetical protein